VTCGERPLRDEQRSLSVLDKHKQLMAAQLDALRTMNKALKPLYAAKATPKGKPTSSSEGLWA